MGARYLSRGTVGATLLATALTWQARAASAGEVFRCVMKETRHISVDGLQATYPRDIYEGDVIVADTTTGLVRLFGMQKYFEVVQAASGGTAGCYRRSIPAPARRRSSSWQSRPTRRPCRSCSPTACSSILGGARSSADYQCRRARWTLSRCGGQRSDRLLGVRQCRTERRLDNRTLTGHAGPSVATGCWLTSRLSGRGTTREDRAVK